MFFSYIMFFLTVSLRQCKGATLNFLDNRFFISALILFLYKIWKTSRAWYFTRICNWNPCLILRQFVQKQRTFSVCQVKMNKHTRPKQEKDNIEKLLWNTDGKQSSSLEKKKKKLPNFLFFFFFWISLGYYQSVKQLFWDLLFSREGFKHLKGKIFGNQVLTNSYGIVGLFHCSRH